jgi:hypothetical protein
VTDPRLASELTTIAIHASAALRRQSDTLEALAKDKAKPDPELQRRALGDVSQAVLSFYLAVAATQRYCRLASASPPFGYPPLATLAGSAEELRNAVLHWDKKREHHVEAVLHADGRGVVVVYQRQVRSAARHKVAGIMWRDFVRCAKALDHWANWLLDPARENYPEV